MTHEDDEDAPGSTVCLAHMLVDGHVIDPQTWKDVSTFRKSERKRLYAARQTQSADERKSASAAISARLDEMLGDVTGRTIAAYWPIRGEVNLHGWMAAVSERGGKVCLPVVVEKHQPVEFHRWTPGCAMAKGFWNIPVPEETQPLVPDVVIVPLLGVDDSGYRLGNGGGYYDRTLVRLGGDKLIIGVGQAFARMKTIFPMPWDIAMHKVVLGDRTVSDHSLG
ncbi:5-formyltetrahydrofolate cyclo-ligase [Hoeflea alexandrii]|uniref:5-formyltetrahydrofolate cyclo-ligase n=1 Tax=Hoeflea alexandrii TaxID=288436 RepID=UPI0022AF0768|nr:5-formyltetrahydrofolate cyclo-ligase [Hoeflea alexandrii]MCZ4290002.1 5-formyltetrahydrofolate cyclo-ligase [Hoeflea alexandrii]